uniref:Glutaredoxin domain-containing protein n=1 Tax=Macrostomum lignano TaxID=282301 RepID=A0A1I8FNQ4_9PLAT
PPSRPAVVAAVRPGQHALTEGAAAVLDAVRRRSVGVLHRLGGHWQVGAASALVGMLPPDAQWSPPAPEWPHCQIGGQTLHSFRGGRRRLRRYRALRIPPPSQPAGVAEAGAVILRLSGPSGPGRMRRSRRTVRRHPAGAVRGDFLQLPPVKAFLTPKGGASRSRVAPGNGRRRCSSARCTGRRTEVVRPAELTFRYGRCEPRHSEMLRSTRRNLDESSANSDKDIVANQLCTHKRQVEALISTSCASCQLSLGPGWPVVRFVGGHERIVDQHEFAARVAGAEMPVIRRQVPLQLAWAI